jgi:hypothetical protein
MKNLFILLITVIVLQSCTSPVVPLKGKYQVGSVKSKINHPVDSVWEAVIDYIADNGVSVKTIDKSCGLIIADVLSFGGLLSQEDNKGNLINPGAFIVVERSSQDSPGKDVRHGAVAQWNLRVKADSDNTSIVIVNLHSIRVDKGIVSLTGQSTGNMEKMIINDIIDGIR